ncbi:kinase-like protein [Phialemonium atrogriseum]|uniref:Kinase-like protein n=1 Tax=Phialemonium atrogriseum TaxID=1093897 RepID=A0AAJ0C5X5_9PEZI|nr:kinase-like protein [Phialemonium atrogriseum]KAK1770560.1 kinase-like protein [Phialemonium atrogriseum]
MAQTPKHEILFSVPFSSLAKPLPSLEKIEKSSLVVKFGVGDDPIEGETLLFVRENSNVAVPQLFAIYQKEWEDTKITYIVMENISGRTLISLWDGLSGFDTLRQLPSPGYFGSVERRKPLDGMFWTDEDLTAINGPFSTEDELIEAMLKRYIRDCGDRVRHRAEYYRRVLPQVLQGNGTAVFTHNDLQRKNIIIRPNGETVIVDWAASGWYPVYWEYATAMFTFEAKKDDWHIYVGKILDEFPNHYIWIDTLRVEMWG